MGDVIATTGHFVCVDCGYDLRAHDVVAATSQQVCPECGLAIEESRDETLRRRFVEDEWPRIAFGARWLAFSHLGFWLGFGVLLAGTSDSAKESLFVALFAACGIASALCMRWIVSRSRLLERTGWRFPVRTAKLLSCLPLLIGAFALLNIAIVIVPIQEPLVALVGVWTGCAAVTYMHLGNALRRAGARYWPAVALLVALVLPLAAAYPLILISSEVFFSRRWDPVTPWIALSFLTFFCAYLAAIAVLVAVDRLNVREVKLLR